MIRSFFDAYESCGFATAMMQRPFGSYMPRLWFVPRKVALIACGCVDSPCSRLGLVGLLFTVRNHGGACSRSISVWRASVRCQDEGVCSSVLWILRFQSLSLAPFLMHACCQTHFFLVAVNCRLQEEGQDFFTYYDEVYDSFDSMGLHENLLRGIYAYGKNYIYIYKYI